MIFGDISDIQLGLVLIAKRGFYDMPSRFGESYYNWGTEIEPLVDQEDIVLAPRKLECDFLFDHRLKPTGEMQNAINALELRKNFILNLEQPIGTIQYDNFYVTFDSVSKRNTYENFETATFSFYERTPQIYSFTTFPQTTISNYRIGDKPPENSGSLPNWFDFSNYKITVKAVRNIGTLKNLKNSVQTVYNSGSKKLYVRPFEIIEIDCIINEINQVESFYRLQAFRNMLSSPGLKDFYYFGDQYNVFWSEGFRATIIGDGSQLKFTFKLNVV